MCLRGLESLRNECASSYVFTSRIKLKTPQVKRNQEKEKKYTLSTKCIFKHLLPVQPDSSIEEEKVKKIIIIKNKFFSFSTHLRIRIFEEWKGSYSISLNQTFIVCR